MRYGALSILCCSALLAAASFGAEADTGPTDDPPRQDGVEDRREADAIDPDAAPASPVEEMVVYGIRTGQLPPVPGPVTHTLFADDFTAENKDLSDLLSETEGVSVRRFGGVGDRAEVTIRGSTPSQVVVTLDDVRANSLLTGGLDLSRVCLPLIDEVEVTSGAGAIESGSGAVGGVVNIRTRAAASTGTRAAFTAGAFETYEGSFLHADVAPQFDYSVGYCGFATQGDFEFTRPIFEIDGVPARFEPDRTKRVNNDREQHAGTLTLGRRMLGGVLRVSSYAVYSSGGEPGVDSTNGVIAGQSTAARSRDLSNLAQIRWHRAETDSGFENLRAMVFHRYESANFRDPLRFTPGPREQDTLLSTFGLKLGGRHAGSLFGVSNRIDLRLDAAHDVLRATAQSGRERPRVGAAVRETLSVLGDRVQLSVGARLDWTDGFDVQVLPSVGLVIAPRPWLRARAHVGRAYRAPNFDELFHPEQPFIRGNPDLDPEDAWNFDVGLELALAKIGPFSNLVLRGSWFRREIDESIIYLLVNAVAVQPTNTGKALSTGFEVSASLEWTRYSRLSVNYTETESRRERTDARLPGQAVREAFAKLRIGPEDAWKLVGEMQHVGEILVQEGDGRVLPDRTVWNANAALNLANIEIIGLGPWFDEFWIFVRGDNLGDVAVRDAQSFPQPGRRLSAGVEGRW